MRFWLSKSSEVPLREQLATQVMLGILSNDLKAGEKLPSTRQLGQRFDIHPNTVSAAYRELARRGWVEFRRGSGVYVLPSADRPSLEGRRKLDHLIATFFKTAREQGFSLREVQQGLQNRLQMSPPDHLLVIEPDVELCRILEAEIREAVHFPVEGAAPSEISASRLAGAAPVCMLSREEVVREVLPAGMSCLSLHARSVTLTLAEQNPLSPDSLIAVASRWSDFLKWTKAVLVGVGASPDALHFCDAGKENWKRGVTGADAVVTDVVTARDVPAESRRIVFRLVADSSIDELRRLVEQL